MTKKKKYNLSQECDDAISSNDGMQIEAAIKKINTVLSSKKMSNERKLACFYTLGNLHSGLSNAYKEDSSGWKTESFPTNRTHAINYFRQALTLAEEIFSPLTYEVQTNLANELSFQGRSIEALELWHINFLLPGDSPFVSSIAKAKELIWLSRWLNDPFHSALYRHKSYYTIKNLKSHVNDDAPPQVKNELENNQEVLKLLEYSAHYESYTGWEAEYKGHKCTATEERYKAWCLENRLVANSLNDISGATIVDQDILQFPDHVVPIEIHGPYFSAAFSALKREFCYARFIAFEGMHKIHPKYEEKRLFLTDTFDGVNYSGSVEKTKTALRVCFSVLDSLSTVMNKYFECGSESPSFSSRWIRDNLKSQSNPFINSLYWLSCDLTDNTKIPLEKWRAPNPSASDIRRIRNSIEHGWLRVVDYGPLGKQTEKGDFAYIISIDELHKQTINVLKIVRAALIYFTLAVSFQEKHTVSNDKFVPAFPVPIKK